MLAGTSYRVPIKSISHESDQKMNLDILKLGLDKNPLPSDINEWDIEHRQQSEIESLVKSVSELSEFILLNARAQEDIFTTQSQAAFAMTRNLPKEERQKNMSHIRLTVRMTRFHTVEMSWNKIKFISNKRRSEGPKIFSEYIKRPPKSYAYSSAIFSGETDWLKASGPKIEQRLAILRQQAAIVSGIRESLFRLSRLTYAYHELLRQDRLPQSNDDLAFLDALMGADVDEAQKASPTSDSPANWISTSEKCQKWMKERQTFALNSTA